MPANHCIPHTEESKRKMSEARRGKANPLRQRPQMVVNGVRLYRCCKCHDFKPISDFYKDKRTVLGLKAECKTCHIQTSITSRDAANSRRLSRESEAKRRAKRAGSIVDIASADMKELDRLWGIECVACHSVVNLEWDHIVPISKGGGHSIANLQRLCSKCNDSKHTKTLDYRSEAQKSWAISFKRVH